MVKPRWAAATSGGCLQNFRFRFQNSICGGGGSPEEEDSRRLTDSASDSHTCYHVTITRAISPLGFNGRHEESIIMIRDA